jgi:hypothetical protein
MILLPPISLKQARIDKPATQREERLREMDGGVLVAVSGDRGRRGGELTKMTTAKKRGPLLYTVFPLRLCPLRLRAEAAAFQF